MLKNVSSYPYKAPSLMRGRRQGRPLVTPELRAVLFPQLRPQRWVSWVLASDVEGAAEGSGVGCWL